MTQFQLFSIFLLISVLNQINGERASSLMYDKVIGASCFRRLNATSSTGCSSTFSGSVGVLHLIESSEDIEFVLNKPPAPPYAPILPANLFTRENVLKLRNSSYVSALVVIPANHSQSLESFSHESKCPNNFQKYTREQTCDINDPKTTWNPFGTGLLLENFNIPIYYLYDDDEATKLVDCFRKFNNFDFKQQSQRSLCSIQIKGFMSAASNSQVCVRRSKSNKNLSQTRFCDPLQSKNVYATLFPREIVDPDTRKNETDEKIILVSARLDTTSMFDGIGLGAMDSLVGFSTLISTGHYLRKLIEDEQEQSAKYNILFALFNGESYDYIGSQRFIYDVQKGAFPDKNSHRNVIRMENIEMMIDIGALDNPHNLIVYQAKEIKDSPLITKFLDNLNKFNSVHNLNVATNLQSAKNLPPTSAQSFLRENRTFPALILYSAEKSNRFYHSIYDDAENVHFQYGNTSKDFDVLDSLDSKTSKFDENSIQMKIRNVSTLIGLSLYEILMGVEYKGNQLASSLLLDEFYYCFLNTSNCRLFEASMKPEIFHVNPWPPNRYISVQSIAGESAGWAYRVLGYVLSKKVINRTKENCTGLPFYYLAGSDFSGECRLTTQNLSVALSPAFIIEDYDFQSNRYSTWTESTWNELSARIFLRPSPFHEASTFSVGFVMLILSFVVVFLVNSRSDVLFGDVAAQQVLPPPTAVVT